MSRADRAPELTTTSYALLAQLVLRPWSAYELAVQQERYLRFFWPRATRALYNELKRLDRLGLAEASVTLIGRRRRTVYRVTDAGRARLRAWLDTPISPLALEFEGLLRVFTAPLGTKAELVANLERIRDDVAGMTALNDRIIAEYAQGRAPFQAQAHVRTLVVDFFTQFLDTTERWVERTLDEVRGWDDLDAAGKELHALARIYQQRHGGPGRAGAPDAPGEAGDEGDRPPAPRER